MAVDMHLDCVDNPLLDATAAFEHAGSIEGRRDTLMSHIRHESALFLPNVVCVLRLATASL